MARQAGQGSQLSVRWTGCSEGGSAQWTNISREGGVGAARALYCAVGGSLSGARQPAPSTLQQWSSDTVNSKQGAKQECTVTIEVSPSPKRIRILVFSLFCLSYISEYKKV